MKSSSKSIRVSGIILFFLGVLAALALCSWYTWGELEASLFIFRTGEVTLKLHCPLILGPAETGVVSASFDNPTALVIVPTVQADIRRPGLTSEENAVLTLQPGEVQRLEWKVDRQDRVFGYLVLVNVFETSQPDFPSHQGSCGIMFSSLPGLSGTTVLLFIYLIILLGLGLGAFLWVHGNPRLRGSLLEASQASATLAGFVGVAATCVLLHWWVPAGLLVLVSIMLIVIIITQFFLFPPGSVQRRSH